MIKKSHILTEFYLQKTMSPCMVGVHKRFIIKSGLWWQARTKDAQRGNSLHCKAENSIPIPNFYVRPKHILSAKLAQFVRYFWFVPSLVRDVRHTVSRLDLINKASQKFCLMISVSSASSFLSLRYSFDPFCQFLSVVLFLSLSYVFL